LRTISASAVLEIGADSWANVWSDEEVRALVSAICSIERGEDASPFLPLVESLGMSLRGERQLSALSEVVEHASKRGQIDLLAEALNWLVHQTAMERGFDKELIGGWLMECANALCEGSNVCRAAHLVSIWLGEVGEAPWAHDLLSRRQAMIEPLAEEVWGLPQTAWCVQADRPSAAWWRMLARLPAKRSDYAMPKLDRSWGEAWGAAKTTIDRAIADEPDEAVREKLSGLKRALMATGPDGTPADTRNSWISRA